MANATMIMMMKYNNFPSFKISVSHARHSYDSSYEHHLHNKKVKLSPWQAVEVYRCVSCEIRISSIYKSVKLSPWHVVENYICFLWGKNIIYI
jgi:hypothetical protein